jgi:hypothetical protein
MNSEVCVSKGATVQTPLWGLEPREQPFTTPPERRAPEAHGFIMPHTVCNYVHRIVLQFYVYFLHIYHSCDQLLFPCLATSLSCAILSQVGLLEVHATYLVSLGYFLARDPVLLNGCSSKKLMLNGGPECVTCLAWSCILSVYTLPP